MKRLITEKIIVDFIKSGGKEFLVDCNTLITPSANDKARSADVKFVYESEVKLPKKEEEVISCTTCVEEVELEITKELVVKAVLEVLKEKGLLK